MTTNRRYSDVSELVRKEGDDAAFADRFAERLAKRQIIKTLLALRAAQDKSQKDIADHMHCTQSRISKLESGTDHDLRLADFEGYMTALGLECQFVIARRDSSIVETVKHHAFALKRKLDELAALVGKDETMAAGANHFMIEALCNLVRFVQSSAQKLPAQENLTRCSVSVVIEEGVKCQPLDDDGSPRLTLCHTSG